LHFNFSYGKIIYITLNNKRKNMTAALNIPQNYAEQLPETIAELKAQQEYFNQLEIAAQEIQKATENYNKLLEQGLTAVPVNNIDYNWDDINNTKDSESAEVEKDIYSQEEIDPNKNTKEKENQDLEQNFEEEEQTETSDYTENSQINNYTQDKEQENISETSNEENIEEDETQVKWPKINLNSLLHKDDDNNNQKY